MLTQHYSTAAFSKEWRISNLREGCVWFSVKGGRTGFCHKVLWFPCYPLLLFAHCLLQGLPSFKVQDPAGLWFLWLQVTTSISSLLPYNKFWDVIKKLLSRLFIPQEWLLELTANFSSEKLPGKESLSWPIKSFQWEPARVYNLHQDLQRGVCGWF